MISLLIADDEGFVRNGLTKNLAWSKLGIDYVEQAIDGQNAFEKAVVMKPDILLTDVRMPRMDGIQLATKLREILPNCKIIFMSGYSDKEYLKSALHLKAVSYIEKPINITEISQVISEAVSMCLEESEKQELDLKKDINLKESLDMLRVNLPLEILHNNAEMEKWLKISNISISGSTRFVTVIFNFAIKEWDALTAKGLGKVYLQKFIHEAFLLKGLKAFSSFKTDNTMLLIALGEYKSPAGYDKILDELSLQILEELKDKCPVFISIGSIVDDTVRVSQSYQAAVIASQQLFFKGYGKFSRMEDRYSQTLELNESIPDEFKGLLQSKDSQKVLDFLKDTAHSIKRCNNTLIPNIKSLYFKMLLVLLNHAARQKIVFSPASSEGELWETLNDFATLDEVESFIMNFAAAYFAEKSKLEGVSRCIADIYEIIEKNYSNPELSIKFICDKLYMSHSHICVLFKKETGNTLNQYITEFRIEKAKEILAGSTVKLYYVASKVGYTDQNYFTKIFKKVTNMTPSEYREMRL